MLGRDKEYRPIVVLDYSKIGKEVKFDFVILIK